MKLPVIGIIIALLTTTLSLAPILLQQQSSGAITGGSLNPATRYCVVGTGAGSNRACIQCDIGLGAGNCRDTLTGSTPCPRYGPIPPNCTLDPFNPLYQVPGTTVTPAPGVLDPTLGAAGGGVAQQPTPIPTPPPLFGRNVGNAPLGEFFGQSPTTPPPQFGQIAPEGQILSPPPPPSAGEDKETPQATQPLATGPPAGEITPEAELQTQDDEAAESDDGEEEPPAEQPEQPETEE